jgi:putative ATP-dependent endonuclease of the OLD family
MAAAPPPPLQPVGAFVAGLRIQDYRPIRHLWIPLRATTVLIGMNNSGKTSVLEALGVALGERGAPEDILVQPDGSRTLSFTIDVLIKPAEGTDFDERLTESLGDAIQIPQKESDPQYFTLRTTGTPDNRRGGLSLQRNFLKGWATSRDEAERLPVMTRPAVTREILNLIAFNLVDARRDIVEQLRSRATFWGRMASSVELADELRQQVELELQALSQKILEGSPLLNMIRQELVTAASALSVGPHDVRVTPLPGKIEELARSMDVLLKAPSSPAIPIGRHGMGTRSLAALMVFRAFVKFRLAQMGRSLPVVLSGFEEPEAHLHPQAQRAVFTLLQDIPGQKIISTHSPYVASIADAFDFRLLRREGGSVKAFWLDDKMPDGTPAFSDEEKDMLRRFVQHQHGEVLFAQLVILFEGDTEEAILPVFANHYWKGGTDSLGVSLVRTGGAGNYKHFLKLLEALRIPWLIFSDGDAAGQKGVGAAQEAIGRPLDRNPPEVVMLPPGQAIENYLLELGYRSQAESAARRCEGDTALEDYRNRHHGQKAKGGVTRDYQSPGWEERLMLDYLKANKGKAYGRALAEEILEQGQPPIPPLILELLERAERRLQTAGAAA